MDKQRFPPAQARCGTCGQDPPSVDLIFEGAEMEPICYVCLARVDPARAAILQRITARRQGGTQ